MAETENPYAASAPTVEEPPVAEHDDHPEMALLMEATQLAQRGKNGANWWYWIAGLSLVNCVIIHAGAGIHFVVGLGVLVFVDAVSIDIANRTPEVASIAHGVAIAFDLLIIAMVAGCGWLSNRRYTLVFAVGMGLYLLDGLLFLLLGDIMSVAFHGFALWNMWNGLQAFRKLNAFERALQSEALA